MFDKRNISWFAGWFLPFSGLIIVATVIIFFNIHNPEKMNALSSGDVVTVGDESFIYVQGEKLTDRRGVTAMLGAISKFQNEHLDLCVVHWHHETVSRESKGDTQSYGIWIHHKTKLPGVC